MKFCDSKEKEMLCGLGHHLRHLIVFDALSKTVSSKVGKWLGPDIPRIEPCKDCIQQIGKRNRSRRVYQ